MEATIKRPSLDVLAAYRELVADTQRLSDIEEERDNLVSRMIQAQEIVNRYHEKG